MWFAIDVHQPCWKHLLPGKFNDSLIKQQFGVAGRGIGCEREQKTNPTHFIGINDGTETNHFHSVATQFGFLAQKQWFYFEQRCGPWIVLTILYALRDLVYCISIPVICLYFILLLFLFLIIVAFLFSGVHPKKKKTIFTNYLLGIRMRNVCVRSGENLSHTVCIKY